MEQKKKRVEFKLNKKAVIIIAAVAMVAVIACIIAGLLPYKPTGERIVLGINTGDGNYGSSLKGCPVPMGDHIGVVTGGNFIVVDDTGKIKNEEKIVLTDPVLHSKGSYTIAADFNGKTAKLYEKGEVKATVTEEGKIISVVTNANGFFAVAREETGYNAVITVYRKNGEAIYRYRITNSTFIDMDISANNRKLVVVEANLKGGTVGSNIVVVEFNREHAESVYYAKGNIYVQVHFNKNGSYVCLGNEKTDIYRADGSKMGEITYNNKKLISADITTDDMICLGFEAGADEDAGTSSLMIYDKEGKIRGSVKFADVIEHVSVNESFIAVSHGDVVDLIKADGKTWATFESTAPVKYGVPFSHGRGVVVYSGGNTVILK